MIIQQLLLLDSCNRGFPNRSNIKRVQPSSLTIFRSRKTTVDNMVCLSKDLVSSYSLACSNMYSVRSIDVTQQFFFYSIPENILLFFINSAKLVGTQKLML